MTSKVYWEGLGYLKAALFCFSHWLDIDQTSKKADKDTENKKKTHINTDISPNPKNADDIKDAVPKGYGVHWVCIFFTFTYMQMLT